MKKHLLLILLMMFLVSPAVPAFSDDAATPCDSALIQLAEHEKKIDAIKTDLDYVWVIISAALVFFMQAGFMALEAGMARSKNSINVAIKNLTDFVLGVVGFWVVGFGIMFGKSFHGLFGQTDFLISIQNPWTAAFFMFQSVFVGTAATIDSGAICERAKLKQYILLSFLLSVIIYPVFGHWAWGSFLHGSDPASGGAGWLEALGFKDFAGSSVVHSVGGWMALAGIIVVGPRLGKYEIDPESGKRLKARTFQPGDMRYVFLGTFILFFGWFGFNCGSTLSAVPDIAPIALNTTLSACFACLVSSALSWMFHPEKKIEGGMIANGVLGGLVGVTAGCAYVDTVGAAIIGCVAGLLVYGSALFIEHVLKLDDVVSAVSVHGVCGAWGTFAVGFFITDAMLGDMSRLEQIRVQALGAGACFVWSFGLGLLFYILVDRFFGGIRVSREHEIIGLNVAEHGATSSLLELANAMDEINKKGNFENHPGVAVDKGTEVGDLAGIFNEMIRRIGTALAESRGQKKKAEELLEETRRQQLLAGKAQQELEESRKFSEKQRQVYTANAVEMVDKVIQETLDIQGRMQETSQITQTMYNTSHELTETLNRMLLSLSAVYPKIHETNEISDSASKNAENARININELKLITREIGEMVSFINEIADKTHILSINSAIEAARANEAGKGFSVISGEVQTLSHKTLQTAGKIGNKLKGIESRVNTVFSSMDNIVEIVNTINSLNKSIIGIIGESEKLTHDLEVQSRASITAVDGVSMDVRDAAQKVEAVARIGEEVKSGLNKLV